MAKYMFEVDYTTEGTQGLIKDGGSKRRAVVEKAVNALGGKLEAFYFTFGIRDAVVIVDVPDQVTAIAISLAVSASGSVRFRTTQLIACEDVDKAAKMKVGYKAPGK